MPDLTNAELDGLERHVNCGCGSGSHVLEEADAKRLLAAYKALRGELESTQLRAANTLARLTESHKELREENSRLKLEAAQVRAAILDTESIEVEALRERVKELGG